MRLLHFGILLGLVTASFADTVRMKDGRVVHGTYLGGSARQVRMEVGDQIQSLDVTDIDRIEFSRMAAPPPEEADVRPTLRRGDEPARREENVMRPDPMTPASRAVDASSFDLPAGTNLVVRMIDGVDSETARRGQTFQASLDQPVMLPNGETAIPRGANVVVKLVDAKESGTFTGKAELALNLQSVQVNGRMVEVNSQSVSRASDSRGGQTAKRGAAGAVVGAGLGAVFGGGKGAAEGAAIGGAAGAGTQVITKGQRVRIPSETRLTFVLDTPVRI